MSAMATLDPPEALVCTMVLVAAADGGMTDREIGVMSAQVQSLPVFRDFTSAGLAVATDTTVHLLDEAAGLDHAARLIRAALGPHLRETAYALGCEVAAADRVEQPETRRMLEFVRDELGIDPLIAAAIERGVRARYRTVDPCSGAD